MSITTFSGVLARVINPSNIPPNIFLIPSHACVQFPVKTPVTKSMIPLNICFISDQIRLTDFPNVFSIVFSVLKLPAQDPSKTPFIKSING